MEKKYDTDVTNDTDSDDTIYLPFRIHTECGSYPIIIQTDIQTKEEAVSDEKT